MQNARLNPANTRDAPVSCARAAIASSPRLAITSAARRKISRRSNAPIVDQPPTAASAASAARVMSAGVPAATRAYTWPSQGETSSASLPELAGTLLPPISRPRSFRASDMTVSVLQANAIALKGVGSGGTWSGARSPGERSEGFHCLGGGHDPAQGAVFVQVTEHLDADGLIEPANQHRVEAGRPDQPGDQGTGRVIVGGVEQPRPVGLLPGGRGQRGGRQRAERLDQPGPGWKQPGQDLAGGLLL